MSPSWLPPFPVTKSSDSGGRWVTMHGTHVFIEGGDITRGPKALIDKTGHPEIDKATATPGHAARGHAIYEAAKHYGDMVLAGKTTDRELIRRHMESALHGAPVKEVADLADKMRHVPAPREKPHQTAAALVERAVDRAGARIRAGLIDRPEKGKAEAEERLRESGYNS